MQALHSLLQSVTVSADPWCASRQDVTAALLPLACRVFDAQILVNSSPNSSVAVAVRIAAVELVRMIVGANSGEVLNTQQGQQTVSSAVLAVAACSRRSVLKRDTHALHIAATPTCCTCMHAQIHVQRMFRDACARVLAYLGAHIRALYRHVPSPMMLFVHSHASSCKCT